MSRTHAALLRGINVGRAMRVAMADLRAIVEGLGCTDVLTLLNSGNVAFTAARIGTSRLASGIEQALDKQLGVASRVIVLPAGEVEAVVADQPFGKQVTDPSRCMVLVPTTALHLDGLKATAQASWHPEAVALGSRAAYVWCPGGLMESRAYQEVARRLGTEVTTRNWATVLKLHAAMR